MEKQICNKCGLEKERKEFRAAERWGKLRKICRQCDRDYISNKRRYTKGVEVEKM
jgi:hypothetical protein